MEEGTQGKEERKEGRKTNTHTYRRKEDEHTYIYIYVCVCVCVCVCIPSDIVTRVSRLIGRDRRAAWREKTS
jgi:hypothetical protein